MGVCCLLQQSLVEGRCILDKLKKILDSSSNWIKCTVGALISTCPPTPAKRIFPIHRGLQDQAIVVVGTQCVVTVCIVGKNIHCCLQLSCVQQNNEGKRTILQSCFYSQLWLTPVVTKIFQSTIVLAALCCHSHSLHTCLFVLAPKVTNCAYHDSQGAFREH